MDSYFYPIYRKIAVWDVFYLFKGLAFSSYFKQIPFIDSEISFIRMYLLRKVAHTIISFITSNSLRFNLASSISDTLAYIVNSADSAGFAYVAADDRVVYPVLAFFENTNIDKHTISSKPELAYMIERTNNYIASYNFDSGVHAITIRR
ncbi:MAG: Spi family protease inhibitor [Paludibacteraceae bacterium]|nr:Spi family protease inhibitor [Paludibacteraceae bacterium]